jgi:chromosome segregation ATPase
MTSIAFDTLKYTKRLEEAGVSRAQAEAQALVQKEVLQEVCDDFASKADVTVLRRDSDGYKSDISGIKAQLESIKSELFALKGQIEGIKSELSSMKINIAVLMWMNGLVILTLVVPAIKGFLGL